VAHFYMIEFTDFSSIRLNSFMRSDFDDFVGNFLSPILATSVRYKRAVGFFSSSVFSVCSADFINYFRKGLHLEIICSHLFSTIDIRAITQAIYNRPEVCARGDLEYHSKQILKNPLNCANFFSWLIATGRVKIRIAIRETKYSKSIFHEKIGFFEDIKGNFIATSGSANETKSGYLVNFERFEIFSSLAAYEDRRKARIIKRHFKELWENSTSGLTVYDLYEVVKLELLQPNDLQSNNNNEKENMNREYATNTPPEVLIPPAGLKLRPHQELAISAWAKAGGSGILEMATGSGKTITALSLISKLYEQSGSGLAIIVVAPFIHLVDQWNNEAKKFGLNPIRCAVSKTKWYEEFSSAIYSFNSGKRPLLSIMTTGATLSSNSFQELLRRIKKTIFFVVDEVHNFESDLKIESFPSRAQFRLGLSATIDPENVTNISDYFGKTVYEYTLKDALEDRILVPYRYFPIPISLNATELEQYTELSILIGRYIHGNEELSIAAKSILIRRARLLSAAEAKIPTLRKLLESNKEDSHILVYCGDGTVQGTDDDINVRQIEEVVRVIGKELRMRCASYTARTPPEKRTSLLNDFAAGKIQVLVAIRCLDEGVDVPATRTAYILASSSNPRQFIQRRGRVLRQFPGKTRAEIYDFLVCPSPEDAPEYTKEYSIMRNLLKRELKRAEEFANLAENGPVAIAKLLELRKYYRLLV
jgi:DNA phosphorothioation system restriction enzyme